MTRRAETVEEVIAALGGPKAVSELMSCKSPNTVPMWKIRGKFPAATFKKFQSALQKRGLSAPSELWGMA